MLFFDAGNAWIGAVDLGDLRRDAGLELRLHLGFLPAPLRFLYGWNLDPREGESRRDFIFSFGAAF